MLTLVCNEVGSGGLLGSIKGAPSGFDEFFTAPWSAGLTTG